MVLSQWELEADNAGMPYAPSCILAPTIANDVSDGMVGFVALKWWRRREALWAMTAKAVGGSAGNESSIGYYHPRCRGSN